MTRRSICSKAALAAALAAAAFVLLPAPARADDRDALERGRAAGRSLLVLRDPRVCGIALLHARCRADAEAFLQKHGGTDADYKNVPAAGPHPATGLRAYVNDGDRDAFDPALGWYNNTQSTEPMWADDARAAALFDAGVEDVFLPAATSGLTERLSWGPVFDLVRHSARIPAGALPLDIAPIRSVTRPSGVVEFPSAMPQFVHDLVTAVDATAPPPPLATLAYTDDVAGDAALGVAAATVRELAQSRMWLAQADAQRFVDAYAARLRAIAPDRARDVADLRAKLRGDASFDASAAQAVHTRLLGAIIGGATPRGQRASIALAAAQISYNANVLRDATTATALLNVLATAGDLDAVPGFASARAEAATTAPADWTAQYKLGLRLVDLLTKGGSN
ncbi:MAG TPA: hypothetical protein VGU66_11245 [Candidatus Elarobacter sp.]|nr:hypothetical protein [Candidatus Elarobacter sp.]